MFYLFEVLFNCLFPIVLYMAGDGDGEGEGEDGEESGFDSAGFGPGAGEIGLTAGPSGVSDSFESEDSGVDWTASGFGLGSDTAPSAVQAAKFEQEQAGYYNEALDSYSRSFDEGFDAQTGGFMETIGNMLTGLGMGRMSGLGGAVALGISLAAPAAASVATIIGGMITLRGEARGRGSHSAAYSVSETEKSTQSIDLSNSKGYDASRTSSDAERKAAATAQAKANIQKALKLMHT